MFICYTYYIMIGRSLTRRSESRPVCARSLRLSALLAPAPWNYLVNIIWLSLSSLVLLSLLLLLLLFTIIIIIIVIINK